MGNEILSPKKCSIIIFRTTALAALVSVLLVSCVSSKKYKAAQASLSDLNNKYAQLQGDLSKCNTDKADAAKKNESLQGEIDNLNKQLAYLKENNTQALKQLQDLSVISATQADNIKKSLENIGAKDSYIQTLQESLARKDSLNMALVMNLKGAVGNLDDQDINIKVDRGVVFIDFPINYYSAAENIISAQVRKLYWEK